MNELSLRPVVATVLLLAGLFAAPHSARAAQSYDNCKGFITTLPATISTQGVWCLKGDLSTSITSGNAITIATNNVTIDCNDFKLGGLAAGTASQAFGILGDGVLNATVRHCNVRGFISGIALFGSGHLVEENRVDNNLVTGIFCDGCVIRSNRVYDTGGMVYLGAPFTQAIGISSNDSDVIDNLVDGAFVHADNASVMGITASGPGHVVRGNAVRNVSFQGLGDAAYGIAASGGGVLVERNFVSAPEGSVFGGSSAGIDGQGSVCVDNSVYHFATATASCSLESNTHSVPGI